jgi:hypothetical protein
VVCYLNRGFILEQAVVSMVNDYFETIKTDQIYSNFHVRATLDHPFAQLFNKEHGKNAADLFPVVVVSTYDDGRPTDLPMPMRPEIVGRGFVKKEIEIIMATTEEVTVNGKTKIKPIPGLCTVVAPETLQAIYDRIEVKGLIYGFSMRSYRKDKISLEIWSENVQLKNEIYEQLRLFVMGNFRHILTSAKYQAHDVKMDYDTVNGQRSGAWNDQFDVALAGANITFDANYAIEQIVLDTEIENPKRDLIMEVNNHV